MIGIDRRDFLSTIAAGGAAVLTGCCLEAKHSTMAIEAERLEPMTKNRFEISLAEWSFHRTLER